MVLSNPISLEFQAVVLAGGGGSRMYPLTEKQPKALLPVGNVPMLAFTLMNLEKAGLSDTLIIARSSDQEYIRKGIKEYAGALRIDFHWIDGECGTADALREAKDKIKKDFIVISSDLIIEAPLHHIVDEHRTHGATSTSLIYEIPKTEDGKRSKVEAGLLDYFGIVKNQLVFTISAADIEDNLEIRHSLLKKFPNVTLHTNMLNAHLYVFKRCVIDLIVERKHISSLQGELLPLLVNAQWRSSPNYAKIADSIPPNPQDAASEYSTCEIKKSNMKCIVFKLDGYCGRANTLPAYFEVNRQILRGVCGSFMTAPRIHPDGGIDSKAQVGPDSIVGHGTQIGEKTSVKKSVIGQHCHIGKNVKIANCVIMDYVTVEDGCKLEGVILCNNSNIRENCSLKDSEVSTGCMVDKGVQAKNEKFVESHASAE